MIIASSAIQLYSERSAQEVTIQRENLSFNGNSQRLGQREGIGDENLSSSRRKQHRIASQDQVHLSRGRHRGRFHRQQVTEVPEGEKATADLNIRILSAMIERLTGKVLPVHLPEESGGDDSTPEAASANVSTDGQAVESVPNEGNSQPTMMYEYYESHYEAEQTSFSASGSIQTADGHSIDFSVQLNMSREFYREQNVRVESGAQLTDPLVLHFNGNAASLSQRQFAFDLDVDGHQDQIAFVDSNSGLLALDANDDGKVTDGSELFGTRSGDGFADLASHDEDGNGWIDENDSIFSRLRVWMKDSTGEDQLFALGEKGIGAIYLQHIATQFSIKDTSNELLGQVRETGLFLYESGQVGTMQQIDLAV